MCQAIKFRQHEIHFRSKQPKLPVRSRGRGEWVLWKGYATVESVKKGQWQHSGALLVEILASRGCSNGVWFPIRQGIRGLLIKTPKGERHVYLLTEPSTHYFKIMTGSARMPVLIKQII